MCFPEIKFKSGTTVWDFKWTSSANKNARLACYYEMDYNRGQLDETNTLPENQESNLHSAQVCSVPLVCWTSQRSVPCSRPCRVLSWEQNPAEWLALCPRGVFRSFSSLPPALLSSLHHAHYTWHMQAERSSGPRRQRRWSHSGVVWQRRNGVIGIEGCVICSGRFHLDVTSVWWRSVRRLWQAAGICSSTFHWPSGCLLGCFRTCCLFPLKQTLREFKKEIHSWD